MPTLRSKRKTATKAAEADATPAVEAKKSKAAEADAAPAVGTKKSKALAIGDNVSALDVELLTEEEETVKLADLVEDKGAVIFMYPKANTSGCTKQACSFGENYTAITALGFDVYGLSFDKPKSQKNWQEKYSLPYHLLTDSDGTVLKAFGAFKLPKNVIRSHVVIAKGGELIDIRNQIASGDSFGEALKTVQEAAKGSA